MIYLCQTEVSFTLAARYFGGLAPRPLVRDPDYLIKTALTETLAGAMIRPWAVHATRHGIATVLGYSKRSPDSLVDSRLLALPTLQQVVGPVIGGPMPKLREGQCYAFEVRICPTIHVTKDGTRRHGERDAFLAAVDNNLGDERLVRETIYTDYLRKRLVGAEITKASLKGFRLNRVARKSAKNSVGQRVLPQAWMDGLLKIRDAGLFEQTLIDGVGRQRAFGHGMVRLRPPSAQ